MRRRGFSVAEVVVAAAVAVVAFAFALSLFRASRRTAESAEAKNDLLQVARMTLETLKADLRGMQVDPREKSTDPVYRDNGIRFKRLAEGPAEDPAYEDVTWSFDLVGRVARRDSSRTGRRSFGDGEVQMRFFNLEEERLASGFAEARAIRVTMTLGRRGDPEGRDFTLRAKIFPPMLERIGAGSWNP